jgi:AP-3 complex subunit beta
VRKIFQYVLSSAKYDLSYDVRDRARLMRAALFREDLQILNAAAVRLFRTSKPLPQDVSPGDSRLRFTLNSLSHLLSATAAGYEALPDFPAEQPDPAARDVLSEPEPPAFEEAQYDDEESFYWDDEEEFYDGEGEEGEEEFYDEDGEEEFYDEDGGGDAFYDDDDAGEFFGDFGEEEGEEEEGEEGEEEGDGDDLDGFFGGAGDENAEQISGISTEDFSPAAGDDGGDIDDFFG